METEEGDEVKEDEEVEFDIVEGADSPLVDDVVPCGSNEAARHVNQTFEETDRKNKEKTSRSRREQRRTARREEKRREIEKKLNAPMNLMIDVASYWACACQRPLNSGT